VDSVLVQSIEEGHWVVFENANFCNPSILDRLNPLLEEGNTSLCINEQGLTETDKLRDIKANPSFRSVFVISAKSLIEQGKDVSRALRNRCLQISMFYDSESNLGGSNVIDTALSQIQFDTQILKEAEKPTSLHFNGLGKRMSHEGPTTEQLVKGLKGTAQ